MFLRVISILFLTLSISTVSYSQDKMTVAVLDLDMLAGVPETYQEALSDILREELFHTGVFRVIERNKMEEILSEQGFQLSGCTSNECAVEVGQLLGVQQMIAGSLSKLGDLHTISLRLVDVETGEVLDMQSVRCHCSIEEIAEFSLSEAAIAISGKKLVDDKNMDSKYIKNLVNGALNGMKFAKIPGGSFLMGNKENISGESCAHQVKITPFLLMTTEVTQNQWQKIMGSNPSIFKGSERPVENISWIDIQEFIRKLNEYDSYNNYRLPTEAEWEYACRAGADTDFYNGNDKSDLEAIAWFEDNSDRTTHNVAGKEPNEWGLFDMHGNVQEWCSDWYATYSPDAQIDPQGPDTGKYKIMRGGSWKIPLKYCVASFRVSNEPTIRSFDFGFRLVREIKEY